MTSEVKVQAYQEAWNALSEKKEVTNLHYPEEKKHFEFEFNISDVEVSYVLNSNVDMLRLEAVKKYENKTELELSQICEDILKDTTDIRSTFYESKIKFLKNTVTTGTEDSVAKQIIDKAVLDFVQFLIANFYVEPKVEEVIEETVEEYIEEKTEKEIEVNPIVYNATEFEDISNVSSFSEELNLERSSKKVSDIKFPVFNDEDFKDDEIVENTENNAATDLLKDFVIPDFSKPLDFTTPTPEPIPTPMPSAPSSFPTSREAELEMRERNLQMKDQDLRRKEYELSQKEQEVSRLYANIEPQKRDIESKYAQLEQHRQALMKAKADLEERAKSLSNPANATINGATRKQIAQYQEYIKELKANEANYETDLKKYEEGYNKIKNSYEVLKVDSNNKIEELNNRVIQLQSENIENVNKGNEEIERLKSVIDECKAETKKVEEERDDYSSRLKEKTEEAEAKDREIRHLQEELAAVPVITPITKIKENLAEEGIEMEIVAGEGGDILTCENYNNCKIVINCNLTIFYIEKAVKKPLKYNGLVSSYNEEDIRYTYIIGNEKIACKGIYQDAVAEVKAALEKFDTFKQQ